MSTGVGAVAGVTRQLSLQRMITSCFYALSVIPRIYDSDDARILFLMFAVKAGDDLRQEQLASQFFALAHRILKQSPLRARAGLR